MSGFGTFPVGLWGGSTAGDYTGPGDVIPTGWTQWGGLRAFSKAVAASGTQKAVNVRRASDNTAIDVYILRSGNLDLWTLAAFLQGTTGFVTKLYDQSGNGADLVNATNATQPQIAPSGGPSSGPVITFNSAASTILTTAGNIAGPSFTSAGIRTSTFTALNTLIGFGGVASMGFLSSANTVYCSAGTTLSRAATDNAWHFVNGVFNGSSSIIAADTNQTTGNAGGASPTARMSIGSFNTGAFLNGSMLEAGRNSAVFTGANITAIEANQNLVWG